eukprot:1406158-Prymnesium_polylepis.1
MQPAHAFAAPAAGWQSATCRAASRQGARCPHSAGLHSNRNACSSLRVMWRVTVSWAHAGVYHARSS